jgi:hypothetical protein
MSTSEPRPQALPSRVWAKMHCWSLRVPSATRRVIRTSRASYDRLPGKRPVNSGGKWRNDWRIGLPMRPSGSVRQDSVSRGCMCGWTRARSTTGIAYMPRLSIGRPNHSGASGSVGCLDTALPFLIRARSLATPGLQARRSPVTQLAHPSHLSTQRYCNPGSERAARDGRAKIRSIMQRIAGPVQ